MSDILDYVNSAAIGASISQLTGKNEDGIIGGGYAALVQAITGTQPTVVTLPNKRARMILTTAQVETLGKWLDKQSATGLSFLSKPGSLDIDLRPVVMPRLLKIVVPTAMLFLTLGWIGHWYLQKGK